MCFNCMAANFLVCKWNEAKCHTVEVKCEILKFILNLKRKNNKKQKTNSSWVSENPRKNIFGPNTELQYK